LPKDERKGSYKMKAHLTAIKKVSRHLALSIYLVYKYFNKQPMYLPYPVKLLNHSVEPPFVDGEDGKQEYLEWLIDKVEK